MITEIIKRYDDIVLYKYKEYYIVSALCEYGFRIYYTYSFLNSAIKKFYHFVNDRKQLSFNF